MLYIFGIDFTCFGKQISCNVVLFKVINEVFETVSMHEFVEVTKIPLRKYFFNFKVDVEIKEAV